LNINQYCMVPVCAPTHKREEKIQYRRIPEWTTCTCFVVLYLIRGSGRSSSQGLQGALGSSPELFELATMSPMVHPPPIFLTDTETCVYFIMYQKTAHFEHSDQFLLSRQTSAPTPGLPCCIYAWPVLLMVTCWLAEKQPQSWPFYVGNLFAKLRARALQQWSRQSAVSTSRQDPLPIGVLRVAPGHQARSLQDGQ